MRMNSFLGKKILSIVRDGNYAHAGEEQAIELVFRDVQKDQSRQMLDVGCGRGGTAQYLHQHGWGQITGLDIDETSIEFAQGSYPDLDFHVCNILDVGSHLNRQFDLIYFFNSFYAFADQPRALRELQRVSHDSTKLLMFDYCDLGGYTENPIITDDGRPFIPTPLVCATLDDLFTQAGWSIIKRMDITPEYDRWYTELMTKIERKKQDIVAVGGMDAWNVVHRRYADLLEAIQNRNLGGIVVEAIAG